MRYIISLNPSSDCDIVKKIGMNTFISYFGITTLLDKTKWEHNCFIISSESGNFNII